MGGAGASSAGSSAAGSGGSPGGVTTGFPDPSSFVCNALLGVSVTGDWFGAGFETPLAGAKWQLKWKSLAFVEQWADPESSVWDEATISACSNGSANPDRVIFTGVNWTFTTEAQWETQLTAVVQTIKGKYSAVKEIDLMTMLRAPDNQECGDPSAPQTREQVVDPFVDAAVAAVAAKFPKLVRVAPAMYAPSCDSFSPNLPHFADGTAPIVAKLYSDYYLNH